MNGIILAALVVGGTGLVIAVLLGVASEKFKVPVDERRLRSENACPATTAVDAVTPAVTDWQKQLPPGKLL